MSGNKRPASRRLKVVFVCSSWDFISNQRLIDFENICADSGLKGAFEYGKAGVDTSDADFATALEGADVVVPAIHTLEFLEALNKKVSASIRGRKPYVVDTLYWDRLEQEGKGFAERLLREVKETPAYIVRMQ